MLYVFTYDIIGGLLIPPSRRTSSRTSSIASSSTWGWRTWRTGGTMAKSPMNDHLPG